MDFEYSGRSDRPYELAELTEHISMRAGNGPGMDRVLDCFDLDSAEVGRLTHCRRLLAVFWLLRITLNSRRSPAHGEVLRKQAARLLMLLG
ncbi:hypothetical protein [Actinomadura latina]|uniref:hypothetical protein n=1 Tax=Actinomadura latina TaxID=163603 RepID=UPI001FDEDA74|nr:hypothetical protein [Actinomadura latina]